MAETAPGYLELYRTGELQARAERLTARLAACDICPHNCCIDRLSGQTGICGISSLPLVASTCAHHGEEPVLSGSRGSGTLFFAGCNMKCCYCQNWQISQHPQDFLDGVMTPRDLAAKMLYLQDELHCHNINFVTPSHVVPQIVQTLVEAVPMGLRLPLVYNTSSYDALSTLRELDGIIDIYLADLRYSSDVAALQYSGVKEYVRHSRAAIMEMQRQVGDLIVDEEGVAISGLIIRHLILPNDIAGSRNSLYWLVDNVSPRVALSVMSQYYPAHMAESYPEIARKITLEEYQRVARLVEQLDIENGWMQDMEAPENYLPDFTQEKPFSD